MPFRKINIHYKTFIENTSQLRSTMKLIIMWCLLALSYAGEQDQVVLCGRQLAKARLLLCYGPEYVSKRGSTLDSVLLDYLSEDENEVDWPWSGRHGSLSADWSRYKRQGLADECCLKPCTRETIRTYCD